MIQKVIFNIFLLTGLSIIVNAQTFQGPKIDSLRLLQDINGGNVEWVTINSGSVQWGDGAGSNNRAFIAALRASVTLPVTVSSFIAKKAGDLVNINWTTSSERNFSHFELLKSTDGKSFSVIAVVTASGNVNSKTDYMFKDVNPTQGANYYQLKMIDLDGTAKESFIVSVQFDLSKPDVNISADSNEGIIKLVIFSNKTESCGVKIVDVQGKQIATKTINLKNGNNMMEFNLKLAPQILIALIDVGNDRIVRKFYY